MSAYALVISHSDRSGIQHVWGPYETERDAQAVWEWLRELGLSGLGEIFLLQVGPPPSERKQQAEQDSKYRSLLAIGIPAEAALQMVLPHVDPKTSEAPA